MPPAARTGPRHLVHVEPQRFAERELVRLERLTVSLGREPLVCDEGGEFEVEGGSDCPAQDDGCGHTVCHDDLHLSGQLTAASSLEARASSSIEFPRRFYLTSRCVVWGLSEIDAWLKERRRLSDAQLFNRAPWL